MQEYSLPTTIGRPATNALQAAGINSIKDLEPLTEAELTSMHGVGPKAVSILKQALETNNLCLRAPKNMKPKKVEIIDGYMIKYHANGKTRWSKGKVVDGQPNDYWEWYRQDGTLKRSGHFDKGEPVGEWTTYDAKGEPYKTSKRG